MIVTCLLILIGTVLVINGTSTPTSSGISTWSGNPSALNTARQQTQQTTATQLAAITPSNASQYGTTTLPYPSGASSDTSSSASALSGAFDYETLMAEIAAGTRPPASSPVSGRASATSSIGVSVWNFIPAGMIATSSPVSGRTPAQQALYLYGNEIGSYVEGYDAQNSDQDQVLSDANNDRQSATKAAAVERIGTSLETVGQGIAETTGVPASAVADNTALANSYIAIGKALVTVGQSEALSDSALVSAIEAYDAAVDTFNKNYIALATLFSTSGVTFSAGDPGSVFTFTSNSL